MFGTHTRYFYSRQVLGLVVLCLVVQCVQCIIVVQFVYCNYLKCAENKLTPSTLMTQTPAKRVAIILFGVPKKFDLVWHAYYKKVIVLNRRPIDIYMHLYNDIKTISTPRNGEYNVSVTQFDEIKKIFYRTGTDVIFIQSSQGEFDESLDGMYQTNDLYNNEYTSMKNVFRQANSLRLAYDSCLLYTSPSPRD